MAAPALPIPPKQYSQSYLRDLTQVLRLYFIGEVDVENPVLTAYSKMKTVTTTGTTLLGLSDGGVILADTTAGNITLTLPAATTSLQYQFIIKRISAGPNVLTINATSGNIDGGATAVINIQYLSLTFRSDGTNYWIV